MLLIWVVICIVGFNVVFDLILHARIEAKDIILCLAFKLQLNSSLLKHGSRMAKRDTGK